MAWFGHFLVAVERCGLLIFSKKKQFSKGTRRKVLLMAIEQRINKKCKHKH